ncbi:MAG: hypothetical protein BYD32DRAFT_440416 [Podila humilis]|nr:MAG: hypothetical protein BYD32DRAFT_440416 [Podila humilis]
MTPTPHITFNTVKELLSEFTTVNNIDAGYQSELYKVVWRMDRTGFRWTSEFGSEVPDCLKNFPDTFPSLDKLKEFQVNPLRLFNPEEKDQYWTAVERRMKTDNQYLVITSTCHEHAAPPETNGRSWRVPILGVGVPGLRSAFALPRSVKEQHGDKDISRAMNGTSPNTRMSFHTLPRQYSELIRDKKRRLFRVDGFMRVSVWDRELAALVIVAKSTRPSKRNKRANSAISARNANAGAEAKQPTTHGFSGVTPDAPQRGRQAARVE